MDSRDIGRPLCACTHIPNVTLVDVIVFVWLSLRKICLWIVKLWAVHAYWPNVTQIDLTVLFVIVVAEVIVD